MNATNFFIEFAKRRHARDFPSFAVRNFDGLPPEVSQPTYARAQIAHESMAIVKAAGIDRIRRELHAKFVSRIRPLSWICLVAALGGSYGTVNYATEHFTEIRKSYQDAILPDSKPVAAAEKVEAAVNRASEAWKGLKERRKAARDDVYDAARSGRQ